MTDITKTQKCTECRKELPFKPDPGCKSESCPHFFYDQYGPLKNGKRPVKKVQHVDREYAERHFNVTIDVPARIVSMLINIDFSEDSKDG